MNIQYKKLYIAVAGLLLAATIFAGVFVSSADALTCGVLPTSICDAADKGGNVKGTGTWLLLKLGVQIMTAGVAILAIIGIIYAAVLYTSAGPNQEQVKKAKDMLRNVVIGIIAFALMAALLQWLVPGGVF
jgi:hypothetical protein